MQLKLSGESITSLELVKQINLFRKKEGKKTELKHHTLLDIIRDEFEQEKNFLVLFYTAKVGNGATKKFPMFELTLSQAKQVLVRESKFVRRAIIKYIEELESQLQLENNQKEMLTPFRKHIKIEKIFKDDYSNEIYAVLKRCEEIEDFIEQIYIKHYYPLYEKIEKLSRLKNRKILDGVLLKYNKQKALSVK